MKGSLGARAFTAAVRASIEDVGVAAFEPM
jgi:hypothetical protein